jgi:hypothetical protein
MKRTVLFTMLLAVAPLAMAQSQSQDQTRAQAQAQAQSRAQAQTRIYGSQLMTPAERSAYRQKMRSARTNTERNRIRAEHHKQMQERAKKRGLTLPNMPNQPMQRGRMQQQGGGMMQKSGGGRGGRGGRGG